MATVIGLQPEGDEILFPHARHAQANVECIERVKEDCKQCHSRLSEPRRPAPVSDGHAACLECHGHAQQYADASPDPPR